MNHKLYTDTETYCEVPINHGTYKYALSCEVMIVSYALDDGPVLVWDRTKSKQMPAALAAALADPDYEVYAHNAAFDRLVMMYAMGIEVPIERWHCTSTRGRAHSLPGKLESLCKLFKVPERLTKKKSGTDLVRLFCMPRPKSSKIRRATKVTHPEQWNEFIIYARNDVEAMRYLDARMPRWNYPNQERQLYSLDQQINDRGFAIDVGMAKNAVATVQRIKRSSQDRADEITGEEQLKLTQRDKMLKFVAKEFGIYLPDMRKSTLQRRIDDEDAPDLLKELLSLRLEASVTGDTKYKAALRSMSPDGRLRGTLAFCGANRTGRWAGRVFQPQNMARIPKWVYPIYDEAADALHDGVLDLMYPNAIELISRLVRGLLIASPGNKLLAADLSNIEGRVLAWLADELWKLDAFRAYDRKEGPDLYVLGYHKSFGTAVQEIIDDDNAGGIMRQIGKVQELSLGYQGWVGALTGMATLYGFDQMFLLEEIEHKGQMRCRANVICGSWREANRNIVNFWYNLARQVTKAIANPGNTYNIGARLKVRRDGAWLRIRLPSGRYLCYPEPKVDAGEISYAGFNAYTRQWQRIYTFGGKLAENVTQAVARDVLAHNMLCINAVGYKIVLTVHDEVIAEAPALSDSLSGAHLGELLSVNPPWADGLPLAADGKEMQRYRK